MGARPPGQTGSQYSGPMAWLDYLSNMNPGQFTPGGANPLMGQLQQNSQAPTLPPIPNQFTGGGPELAAAGGYRPAPPTAQPSAGGLRPPNHVLGPGALADLSNVGAPTTSTNLFPQGGTNYTGLGPHGEPRAPNPATTGGAKPQEPGSWTTFRYDVAGSPYAGRTSGPQAPIYTARQFGNWGAQPANAANPAVNPNLASPNAQNTSGILSRNKPPWATWPMPPRRPIGFGTNDSSYPPLASSG